jgi:ribosomal protein S19
MNNNNNFYIFSRKSVILKNFINKDIYIYVGNKFKKIVINENMINLKIKEFTLTKNMTRLIHLKKKLKKKNKIKKK